MSLSSAASASTAPATARRSLGWTAAVLLVSAPVLISLFLVLWRTPYPISEAVALFEDAARAQSVERFVTPDTSYYRPLYHLSLMAIWHQSGSLLTKLAAVKLLHFVPVALLVFLFICHMRPRTGFEAGAAAVAVALLVGSPGFRDNIELPLAYTAVGMPLALAVWALLNREPRVWRQLAIILLTCVAIGFKEQGLIIVPIVGIAWLMRAPGARPWLVMTLVGITVAYIAFRLEWRGKWPLFEQSMGLGFSSLEPSEAEARFGDFPYWMYAYSSMSTMLNVLFSEPTRGLFFISRDVVYNQVQTWEVVQILSSVLMTSVIVWWGVRRVRADLAAGWSDESRTFVALIVALAACGVLSFNYSRDRLGGMALVFYAVAAYYALRSLGEKMSGAVGPRAVVIGATLFILAVTWQLRAVGTVEYARRTAWRNQMEWMADLPKRRAEFVDRPVYTNIMESMVAQGTAPGAPEPTRYPEWLSRVFLPRP
jgi:hypothetical protein